MLLVAELNDLVCEGFNVREGSVFILLELKLTGVSVENDNRRNNPAFLKAPGLLHQFVHYVDRGEWLACQVVHELLFELVQEDVVKDNQ